jgi:hypothetical protein
MPNPSLEELDAAAAMIERMRADVLAEVAKAATIPEPDRPVENPIARLQRLRPVGALVGEADPLPPPPPPPIPMEVDGVPAFITPVPENMVEVDTSISHLPVSDETWRDIMFKPGMAAAMMYVLHPVIEAASDGRYTSMERLVEDLAAWDRMTIVEQVALTDLFAWVESEVYRGEDSMIPPPLRANMQRAYESYAQGS